MGAVVAGAVVAASCAAARAGTQKGVEIAAADRITSPGRQKWRIE
jgi:hypothetical protein